MENQSKVVHLEKAVEDNKDHIAELGKNVASLMISNAKIETEMTHMKEKMNKMDERDEKVFETVSNINEIIAKTNGSMTVRRFFEEKGVGLIITLLGAAIIWFASKAIS